MAESTSVALAVAPFPTPADITRAEKLVRERFVQQGEDPEVALATGTPRRRALDRALAELEADPKAKHPSTEWRREFSLLLGLERLLSEEEPKLADGTVLSAHQVDALSGTLAALLAEAQRPAGGANGRAAESASPELLASADILGPEHDVQPPASEAPSAPDDDLGPVQRAAPDVDEEEEEEEDEDEVELAEDEEVEEERELQSESDEEL